MTQSGPPIHQQRALADEQGFTLIEVLVVIIVIAILAAIALPLFIGQSTKAKDATAKSNVRNLVSLVESCRADKTDFTKCDTETKLTDSGNNPINLAYGSAQGEVEVTASTADTYSAVAHSTSGNNFTVSHNAGGTNDRTCTATGTGGCPNSGNW